MESVRSYLVFDFETTGLDPDRERIIQVGLCLVSDTRVIDRRGWLVNQDIRVPREATAIHGITTDDIRAQGIPARESLARLLDAMNHAPMCIGHNIHRFDVPFLLAESRRHGAQPPDCTHFVDTAAIFKGRKLRMSRNPVETPKAYAERVFSIRAPGLKYSIPKCLEELGIVVGALQLHDAGHDAYLTHLIFQALQERL
jgi:DNA polymerase III epsilon subunit-like protein